ncbi:hypothetical protein C447_12757 [Halococcus hamelinensis 100A6]|uniref:TIGR00341 family protein n=2 Tax=Halococcus hamelinensis TaxID=332168 RepID=M0LVW3_9EURY|nr:DUF389 domain-containing protein [Halococcus hamelinensis]EMA37591.1 hypothetical protein C447_12757 [Halococcus hamelinensis 100A6]
MRLIRLLADEEHLEEIFEILDDNDIDFIVTPGDEDSPSSKVIEFPIPTDGLGLILEEIREAGLDDDYIIVLNAENANTPHIEELQERYANDYDPLRLPELRSKARDQSQDPLSYAMMIFLSAIIAAAGLLVGSPAIVVGSMVIAPLVGPVLTATVGAVADDRPMLVDSVRIQALGLVAGVIGAVLFGLVVKTIGLAPTSLDITSLQLVSLRAAPTPFSIIVGAAAGAAAAFGLTTKGSNSLVGVMIAAALIPAAATVGIALAWSEYLVALGSGLLLVSTMAVVNLAMYLVLWVLYRDQDPSKLSFGDRVPTRAALVTVVLIVGAVAVAGIAVSQQALFQQTATQSVDAVLDDPAYSGVNSVSVQTEYAGLGSRLTSSSKSATVTVSASNESYPNLSEHLRDRIQSRAGGTRVTVRFSTFQQANQTRAG